MADYIPSDQEINNVATLLQLYLVNPNEVTKKAVIDNLVDILGVSKIDTENFARKLLNRLVITQEDMKALDDLRDGFRVKLNSVYRTGLDLMNKLNDVLADGVFRQEKDLAELKQLSSDEQLQVLGYKLPEQFTYVGSEAAAQVSSVLKKTCYDLLKALDTCVIELTGKQPITSDQNVELMSSVSTQSPKNSAEKAGGLVGAIRGDTDAFFAEPKRITVDTTRAFVERVQSNLYNLSKVPGVSQTSGMTTAKNIFAAIFALIPILIYTKVTTGSFDWRVCKSDSEKTANKALADLKRVEVKVRLAAAEVSSEASKAPTVA